jgi:L-ascorbate metabolism protein UlaG (beta-lactamase superfamily)
MAKRYYSGPVSDHFDGTRFYVPGHDGDKTQKDMLRWTFSERRARWPKSFASPYADQPPPRFQGLRSTLIGHASFLVQTAGVNVLIDPVFAQRASPLSFAGPSRVNPPGIAFSDLPDIDVVLLTHNHYDHMDKAALWAIGKKWQPRFIGPLGTDGDIARGRKLPGAVTTLDWGDEARVGPLHIHAVPTYHWSARGVRDRRKSLWCSYVVTSAAGRLYHIGDTGYGAGEFSKRVLRDFGAPDLAHIPIGAYAPRWFMKEHHVNPEEAVQIFQDCGASAAIGHHWGTFQLTNEPHEEPAEHLAAAVEQAGIEAQRFRAFRPGQVWSRG